MASRPQRPSYRTASGLRRIEDLRGPPKVGAFYDVPVILGLTDLSRSPLMFPIIPTPHSDDGLAIEHVHLDARFATEDEIEAIGGVLPHQPSPTDTGHVLTPPAGQRCADLVTRAPRVCLRPLPQWNARNGWTGGKAISGATDAPARPVRDGDRLLCPHRGADVTHLRPDCHGWARCPLHGQLLDLRK